MSQIEVNGSLARPFQTYGGTAHLLGKWIRRVIQKTQDLGSASQALSVLFVLMQGPKYRLSRSTGRAEFYFQSTAFDVCFVLLAQMSLHGIFPWAMCSFTQRCRQQGMCGIVAVGLHSCLFAHLALTNMSRPSQKTRHPDRCAAWRVVTVGQVKLRGFVPVVTCWKWNLPSTKIPFAQLDSLFLSELKVLLLVRNWAQQVWSTQLSSAEEFLCSSANLSGTLWLKQERDSVTPFSFTFLHKTPKMFVSIVCVAGLTPGGSWRQIVDFFQRGCASFVTLVRWNPACSAEWSSSAPRVIALDVPCTRKVPCHVREKLMFNK